MPKRRLRPGCHLPPGSLLPPPHHRSPRQGAYLSPRVANLLLQHATQALAFPATWRALKPHVPALLSHVVFPLLCFDDDDAELWVDDPHEYIRKVQGVVRGGGGLVSRWRRGDCPG